ncbi:hypothetical protein CANINC_002559 [Pichia inconspicua]|uniref:Uncharacterized protein n=1 Tax=Pichia inconspicua TaxID=52247 RepID=A0A4T0X1E9_9ASCO|nr:hypothetical protein CANINC_002559 [[Candida] inconspicua]
MALPTPTADEYEQFTTNLPTKVTPSAFLQHLEVLVQLESRLNYRFLELEAKLRFLRLLTAGTETPVIDDNDLENAKEKLDLLNTQIESLKKQGKSIRRKIEKCIHHPDVKRCVEGKPVLEKEIEDIEKEIQEMNTYFNSLGLPSDLTFPSLSTMQAQCDELETEFSSLQKQLNDLQVEETELDEEIAQLEKTKYELGEKLKSLSDNVTTDIEVQEKYKQLTKMIALWEQF